MLQKFLEFTFTHWVFSEPVTLQQDVGPENTMSFKVINRKYKSIFDVDIVNDLGESVIIEVQPNSNQKLLILQ